MALFKIFKGNAAQLPALKTEGYMYITQDNGDIYVDISGTERKQLNANYANKLRDSTNITQLLNMGDAGQAVYFVDGIPALCREHVDLETTQNIGGNKYFTANHIGFINGGETDKFFDFAYSSDPTKSTAPGASWRIGALNSGSGNTNYFVIQTGGSDTTATTWKNAMRIGMNDLDVTFGGSVTSSSGFIGNASSATKLATKRAINGTDFDGTEAITTAKWGTTRTISINSSAGVTGTNIDGSANASLTIPTTMTGFTSITSTTFVGALSGNATTATTLQTARTINGTSFNGSANITTANWGTARTISISATAGTTGTSVNGSANASLVIPSTITGFASITSTTFVGALNGNAASASSLKSSSHLTTTDAMDSFVYANEVKFATFKLGADANNLGFGANDGMLLSIPWTSTTYAVQLAVDDAGRKMSIRSKSTTWTEWARILTSVNYTDYTVTKTGTGASGTWGISVSGNAATATKLATARTISLTGDVTGSGTFDGSGNLSITATVADNSHSHSYLPLAGGTMSGNITLKDSSYHLQRSGISTSWYLGRSVALIKTTSYSGYDAIWSMKTTNGDWSQGVYTNDILYWTYFTDTNFNNKNNSPTTQMTLTSAGVLSATQVKGAVWNDYAEYRKAESIEPGRVVIENIDGEMKVSTERLQPGAEIISDTFGFAIGETDEYKTPIAATGRVLAYTNEDRYSYPLGCAVCSGPNGTVSQMTREEIREYPERIIGTVSEIPEYKTWGTGNVEVNGRIWIRIK